MDEIISFVEWCEDMTEGEYDEDRQGAVCRFAQGTEVRFSPSGVTAQAEYHGSPETFEGDDYRVDPTGSLILTNDAIDTVAIEERSGVGVEGTTLSANKLPGRNRR